MYHAVVRAKVRRLWERVGAGDHLAAVRLAAPDVRFKFVGEPPLGAEFTGRDRLEQWFRGMQEVLPGLRITLVDVVVRGWPWRTTVVTRLTMAGTLADGGEYRNEGVQWVTLKWGRMVDDYVLEDTARLAEALRGRTGSPA
ncbi:nuclear transport factor 2 family protein [Saccharothrix syringae]|uniref:nuclear transport factor 2 family protein n=1 Tax=Saccharothrix syringae TaxID=103733 RepID=UPI00068B6340|nr:nuclear transport factor 2 family protein [Saccharothrix syringae]